MLVTHELKTDQDPFSALWNGRKTAEFRKDDRTPKFASGQYLFLREQRQKTGHLINEYTGRWIVVLITDVRTGYGISVGHAMLSIAIVVRSPEIVKLDH